MYVPSFVKFCPPLGGWLSVCVCMCEFCGAAVHTVTASASLAVFSRSSYQKHRVKRPQRRRQHNCAFQFREGVREQIYFYSKLYLSKLFFCCCLSEQVLRWISVCWGLILWFNKFKKKSQIYVCFWKLCK